MLAITPGATINTKGAYVQMTAACPADICALTVGIFFNPQTAAETLVSMDIAVGGAGSEAIVIPDIVVDASAQFGLTLFNTIFPIQIPKGTRIAARSQANAASATNYILLTANSFDGGFAYEGYARYDSIGVSGTPILGTNVTPSATANTKGSYAQLIASTARDYSGFVLSVDTRGIAGANTYAVDVAVGGAGSEVVVMTNHSVNTGTTGAKAQNTPFIGVPIPAGTRVSARCASNVGSDTHTIGAALYGAY